MSAINGKSMLEVLRDFVEKVSTIGIHYMVTGSFAMSVYGEIRFTRDIDILIELAEGNADKFFGLFENDYYISKNSLERAVRERKMFNIIHLEKAVKIDCIICKETEFEKLKFSHRRKVKVGELEFWTITKEDLILSKLNWSKNSLSEMQIKDIANLTETSYDGEYVKFWIEKLNLREIWNEVGKWKTRQEK